MLQQEQRQGPVLLAQLAPVLVRQPLLRRLVWRLVWRPVRQSCSSSSTRWRLSVRQRQLFVVDLELVPGLQSREAVQSQ